MSNDDLKEGDSDFSNICYGRMENNSAAIISILKLFRQTVFDKKCDNSDNICYASTLLKQIFAKTKFNCWYVKIKISINFLKFLKISMQDLCE